MTQETNKQSVSRSISGGDKVVVSSYGNWQAEKGNRELIPTNIEEFYTDDFLHYYTVTLYQELLESIESYISENDSRERETFADYYRAMKSGGAELIYNYLTFFEYKGSHFYTYSILDELSKVIGEYELTEVSVELIERELYSMVKRLLTTADNPNANNKVKVYLSEYNLEVEITVEEFYNKYLIALSNNIRKAMDERHRLCGNEYGYTEVADKLTVSRFLAGDARRDPLRKGMISWGDTITNHHGYAFTYYDLIRGLYSLDDNLSQLISKPNLIKNSLRKAADELLTMTPNTNKR